MALNETTGKAYMAESSGSNAYGLDWSYLSFQATMASWLHYYSGDTKHLRLTNVLTNKVIERVNTTTGNVTSPVDGATVTPWVLDAKGGTRVNILTAYLSNSIEYLQWRDYRTDMTYELNRHWNDKILLEFRNAQYVTNWANENFWSGVGETLAAVLMSSPLFLMYRT